MLPVIYFYVYIWLGLVPVTREKMTLCQCTLSNFFISGAAIRSSVFYVFSVFTHITICNFSEEIKPVILVWAVMYVHILYISVVKTDIGSS